MADTLGDEVMEPTFDTSGLAKLPWKWIAVGSVVAAVVGFAIGRYMK